jgi:hypothetical protein
MMFTADKDGGSHDRKGSVFRSADLNRTFQSFPAPDDKLVQMFTLKKSVSILTILSTKRKG